MADGNIEEREARYRLTVEPSDVHSAISEIETASQRAAQSVTAMASNLLSTLRATASDSFGITQMAMRDAAGMMYANAPRPGMAQMGPSMVGPMGMPSINLFRPGAYGGGYQYQYGSSAGHQTAQGLPYTPPVSPILYPRAQATREQARSLFESGEGGAGNIGSMLWRMFQRGQGHIGGGADLDQPIYNYIEQQSEAFSRNVGNFATGDLPGFAMLAGGMMMGGPVGGALALASGIPALARAGIAQAARPYSHSADLMREATAPYIYGSRLGTGLTERETAGVQQDITKMAGDDRFFTAREYKDIVQLTADSGAFQFTRNKEEAMSAIKNIGETFKTLHFIGIQSKEQLDAIMQMSASFGITPGADVKRSAHVANMASVTAMGAGVSPITVMQRAQATAQLYASQGLHPGLGGRLGMMNEAMGGYVTRNQLLPGGFVGAYFGGQEGVSQSLNAGMASMMRSPWGQMQMLAQYGMGQRSDGNMGFGNTMGRLMQMARNPLDMAANQLFLPMSSQDASSADGMKMLGSRIDMYKKLLRTDKLDQILGVMVQSGEIDQNFALSAAGLIAGADEAGANLQRNIGDQLGRNELEAMRGMGFGRSWERFTDRMKRPFAGMDADIRTWQAKAIQEPFEQFWTGQHKAALGHAADFGLDPMETARQAKILDSLEKDGFTLPKRDSMLTNEIAMRNITLSDAREMASRNGWNNLVADEFQRLTREGRSDSQSQALQAAPNSKEAQDLIIRAANNVDSARKGNSSLVFGMNSFDKMTEDERAGISNYVTQRMRSPEARAKLTSAVSGNRSLEQSAKELGQIVGGSSAEEQGRNIKALDPNVLPSGVARDRLKRIQSELPTYGKNKQIKQAEELVKDREGLANILTAGIQFGDHGDEWLELIKDGSISDLKIVEQVGISQMILSDPKNAEKRLREVYGDSKLDIYSLVGVDGAKTPEALRKKALANLDPNGVAFSNFKGGGHQKELISQANRAQHGRNLGLVSRSAQLGMDIAGAAAGGANGSLGGELRAQLERLGPEKLSKVEETLGMTIPEFLGAGDSSTAAGRFGQMQKLAGVLKGVSGIGDVMNAQALDAIASGDGEALGKVYGDKSLFGGIGKSKDALMETAARSALSDKNFKDKRLYANESGAFNLDKKAIEGVGASVSELSTNLNALKDIAGGVDVSNITALLDKMKSTNTDLGSGSGGGAPSTIKADTVHLHGTVITHDDKSPVSPGATSNRNAAAAIPDRAKHNKNATLPPANDRP